MGSKNQDKIVSLLKRVAETSDNIGNAKLAAGIYYRKNLVALGVNSAKTHPMQAKYSVIPGAYVHAEMAAIINALKKISVEELKKSTLYVTRIKKDYSVGLSKPCAACQAAIFSFGIKTVFYTENDQTISQL